MAKPGSELVGRTFLHKHWLDPVAMPDKVPAEFKVTAVRQGQVYIRPIYDKGGNNERLGGGLYRPLSTFEEKDVLRWTNPNPSPKQRGNPHFTSPYDAGREYALTVGNSSPSQREERFKNWLLSVGGTPGTNLSYGYKIRFDKGYREGMQALRGGEGKRGNPHSAGYLVKLTRLLPDGSRDFLNSVEFPKIESAKRTAANWTRGSSDLYATIYDLQDQGKAYYQYHKGRKVAQHSNPGSLAEQISEGFHGRPPQETIEVEEDELYPTDLAILGCLVELNVTRDGGDTAISLRFKTPKTPGYKRGEEVYVAAPNRHQIEFVGGDQCIVNLEEIAKHTDKQLVKLGCVDSIVYLTDKHHLTDSNGKEEEYEHDFGKKKMFGFKGRSGRPELLYDVMNEQLKLVGGSYSIADEGITN
jgi:hypothetical protein